MWKKYSHRSQNSSSIEEKLHRKKKKGTNYRGATQGRAPTES